MSDRDRTVRLQVVRRRLEEHAAEGPPPGLTDPDPGGTERWEAGQVWAHLAEFPAYWLAEVRKILRGHAAAGGDAVPFGRTRADAARVEAIERDRRADPAELLRRTTDAMAETQATLERLSPDEWEARGMHPTRGEMTVAEVVDRFIVEHLEEHADQLDRLREAG